ncbi:hypothetical protein JW826_06305 [Candidatus Woesearchaeota archaeon]|nr:hypothetical protein [Candidatus Woesearchaeota archaeon]
MISERQITFIAEGSDGFIYRLGKDKVAKFEKTIAREIPSSTGKKTKREYRMGRFLYENGISVPRPHGIELITLSSDTQGVTWPRGFSSRAYPAFVMDYIEGVVLDDLVFSINAGTNTPWQERKHARKMYNREIEKVRDLFVAPLDLGLHNSIWNREEDRIYLIDFQGWILPRIPKEQTL